MANCQRITIDFETEPEIPLTIAAIDEDDAPYTQRINLIIQNINDAPVVLNPIEPQSAVLPFTFTLPVQTFGDEDGDQLSYAATLRNGDSLPPWLTFAPMTQTFTADDTDLPASSVNILVTAKTPMGYLQPLRLMSYSNPA